MKQCGKCNQTKPLSQFNEFVKTGTIPYGKKVICNSCEKR